MNELDSLKINFSPQSMVLLNIILAFVMFGIALDLKKEDFINLARNKKPALIGLSAHFILLPLLTFLLVKLLHPPPSVALGMILIGACPGGNMSNIFTHFAKGNTALAVGLTSVSHFLAIALTPFNFSFYGSIDSGTATLLRQIHLSYTDIFQTIAIVVGIPLALGFLLNHYRPGLAEKLKKVMRLFSLIAVATFIVAACAANARVFWDNLSFILPLVIIHNAVALSAGFLFAKLAMLEFRDCKTITFETGVQNSGLGLILIFTFFNGLGGMALVASCWGVWHMVTGGTLAFIWGRNTEARRNRVNSRER